MAKPKFDPEWDITYLLDKNDYHYHVIKNPEPIPGTGDYDQLFVTEGITVHDDGRWYYWHLLEPTEYNEWKMMNGLVDLNDEDEDGEFAPTGADRSVGRRADRRRPGDGRPRRSAESAGGDEQPSERRTRGRPDRERSESPIRRTRR